LLSRLSKDCVFVKPSSDNYKGLTDTQEHI
jgi:hypothetical protein